jgi:hypothetical protein
MTSPNDDWIASFATSSDIASQSSPSGTLVSGASYVSGEYGGGAKRSTLFFVLPTTVDC